MLQMFAFLACIILAMPASIPGQTTNNVGGMFRFSKKKEISENN
jgi:hypothetical protein